jgi:hypothetical protein
MPTTTTTTTTKTWLLRIGTTGFAVTSHRSKTVLNDLKMARLSRGRMIWLNDNPHPLPLLSVSSTGDTQED